MSNYIFLAPKLAGDYNITTSSSPASCLMSPGPGSGFSQTTAECQGSRGEASPVPSHPEAAASGHVLKGGPGYL